MKAGGNVAQLEGRQQASTRNNNYFSVQVRTTSGSTSAGFSTFMPRLTRHTFGGSETNPSNGSGRSMMSGSMGLFQPTSSIYSNSGQNSGESRRTPEIYGNTRVRTPRNPQEFHTP
jgi:hypothetical protein